METDHGRTDLLLQLQMQSLQIFILLHQIQYLVQGILRLKMGAFLKLLLEIQLMQ